MNKRAAALVLLLAAGSGAARADEAPASAKAGQLKDIVIRSEDKDEPSAGKPPLEISYDPYEALRPSLKPDESLLLAESPALVDWSRMRPDRLKNERLLQPWNDALAEVKEVKLDPRAQLEAAAGRPFDGKAAKGASWTVSVVDEEGKPIRKFEGAGLPPETLAWNGVSDSGDWLRAGHAYSAVYKYAEPAGQGRTSLGRPIQFAGLVHEAGSAGRLIGLDSAVLFGINRRDRDVASQGRVMLRAAADWIRRHAYGSPALLRLYGPDAATAETQASAARSFLAAELGVSPERIAVEAASAPPAEQRLDLLVGQR